MNKPWKLVLLLTGIFLAGGVAGVFLTVRFGRHWISQRAAPDQWASIHVRKLAERLELKPEQVEQIRPIIRRNMEELGRVRIESMTATRAIFERMEKEITERLTPEQRTKFEEYNREKRERLRKMMQKKPGDQRRGEEHRDDPAPPPPGPPPAEPGT